MSDIVSDKQKIKLINQIIIDTLKTIKIIPYSNKARRLLLLTAIVESQCFKYNTQNVKNFDAKKHAISFFQIEYNTFIDCYENYLKYRPEMLKEILSFSKYDTFDLNSFLEMKDNINFAIAVARVIYYRKPEPLPNTVYECAAYWKKWYNTEKGKGTIYHFIDIVNYYFKEEIKIKEENKK